MAQLVSLGLGGSAGAVERCLDGGWILPAIDEMVGGSASSGSRSTRTAAVSAARSPATARRTAEPGTRKAERG